MDSSDDVTTLEGRIATFDRPHYFNKRRASASNKKKAQSTVTWPHKRPTPQDVRIRLHSSRRHSNPLLASSLLAPVSISSRPLKTRIASPVSFAAKLLMAGIPKMILLSSTSRTFRIAAGLSMLQLNDGVRMKIAQKKLLSMKE